MVQLKDIGKIINYSKIYKENKIKRELKINNELIKKIYNFGYFWNKISKEQKNKWIKLATGKEINKNIIDMIIKYTKEVEICNFIKDYTNKENEEIIKNENEVYNFKNNISKFWTEQTNENKKILIKVINKYCENQENKNIDKSGKNEIINVINYINKNKIIFEKETNEKIKELIKIWKNNNKTLTDYTNMINYLHPIISYLICEHKDNKLKELWEKYKKITIKHKIKLMDNVIQSNNPIIKKSLIDNSGNGLFTTKSYKEGEFICYYDGEERNIESLNDAIYSIGNPFNNKILIGYNYKKNENGVGQLINDYCIFQLTDDDINENGTYKLSSKKINRKINEYNSMSKLKSNIVFKDKFKDKFKLYASKDINENEELYLHYGINYWISIIQITTDEPLKKLYCLLKNDVFKIKNKIIYIDNIEYEPKKIFNFLKILPDGNIIKSLKLNKLTDKNKILQLIELSK
jgi:hypothetical protein